MIKCSKCRKDVEGCVHYCPHCGTLLPGKKERALVTEDEYIQAVKGSNCKEIDSKVWNDIKSFYQSHLSTGYAPKGKQLIAKSELAQLRKNNIEYEQAVKANGKDYLGRIRYNVTQRHQKKINHVGFEDFWKKKIKDNELLLWGGFALYLILMILYSVLCIGLMVLLIENLGLGLWGFVPLLLIVTPIVWGFIYIGKLIEIFD